MNIRFITYLAIVASLALITGCGDSSSSAQTGNTANGEARCAKPINAGRDQKAPAVAVLAPVGADSPVTASTFAKTITTVVDGSKAMKARFVLNGIAEGPGAPNLLVNVGMFAEGPNPLMRRSNLDCKTTLITDKTKQLSTGGVPQTLDTISALSTLKDDLKTISSRPVHVVVIGSALTRTQIGDGSFVDLRDPTVLRDPAATINKLARASLNFRCEGWKVTMIGGSRDTNGKPVSAETDSQLKRFWRLYFQHCGGALVAYSTQIAQFPVTGGAIEEADARIIPIAIKRTPEAITATLSSKVLFDISSAALRPEADGTLQQLIPLVTEAKGAIDVYGYTDNSGTDEINQPLSRARAAAVASWLTKRTNLATARLRVHGRGSTNPVASNATETGRAKNRRVVVTIRR
jgi:outer membrane protein OmpA-like peptidoglycan-associated protein